MTDFETVFRENNKFVFRFLMKLCADASLAEELTQETFFRAYMNLSGLRDETKVSSWLCQIAKNTYYSRFQKQKRELPLEGRSADAATPDIAALFEEKELADTAFSCLHALDEPYKEVFLLFVFGGLSLKEISTLFGKSESWARVTFYRAKQKMMKGLENKNEL